MSFDEAMRLTELLLGFAFAQQSLEHLVARRNEQIIFIPRLFLSILLMLGFQTGWVILLLMLIGLMQLYRFQGPYNGGSDRMSLLILFCLSLKTLAPDQYWRELAVGYLALQLVLSYFISGWVKVVNQEWRSGRALCDVFQFSAYPVSESLRSLAQSPCLLFTMAWCVMIFELVFPVALFSQESLIVALIIAAMFHFSNACFFGLNRFFWIWISGYPSIIWFQGRVIGVF
ncbi:MAG: HTTM domain-containing protein [Gammaproteobacteria bacterium]|nr:HTTM domain-containing protein [Gammaproteobacteria bacterium]